MDLAAGLELRAPTSSDFDAVATVVVAEDMNVSGEVVLGADFVRGEWSRTDLATDAWVVLDGGAVVGYGQVTRDDPGVVGSWGVVHPAQRGRGIGTALLDRIEERAVALRSADPSLKFWHSINAGDQAAEALLGARGFRPIHHFWHMQIDVPDPFDPGRSPDGIDIGPIDPAQDLPDIHAMLVDAFAEDLSHRPLPFEAWVDEETTGPGYDPSLWLLARDGHEPVGIVTASAADDRGWVDYLAVSAAARGRGVGSSLLRRSFALFADRGIGRVLVSVDAQNPTGATRVYEGVGMRVVRGWDLWELA